MHSTSRPKRRVSAVGLAAALVFGLAGTVSAQETGTVQGTVVDADALRPLSEVQITVVGTRLGTLTDDRGRFQISRVPAGEQTLRLQMLGYGVVERTVDVPAGGTATVELELQISALAMDEIIVTGVGQATERRELSTSVAVLSGDVIEQAPVQTLDQLLQGRVAGATVNAVSAQPGTSSLINFRGVSSVFGAQTPVIYVDGVRVDNSQSTAGDTGGEQTSALTELLTSDIERIEITRGGAASTLYGSDAATGVIQIFTKRGQPGAPRITARVEQGMDTPELKYLLDARHIYPDLVESGSAPGDFVERNFFDNGHFQSYNVGVSGGTDNSTYSVSGRVQQSDGVQPKNDQEIYNLRGGLEAQLSDRVRTHFTGSYTRTDFNRLFNSIAIADPITALEVGDVMFFTGQNNLQDALDIFLMPDITESVDRFQFSAGVQYEHSDLLSARLTGGVDHRGNQQRIFEPLGFFPGNSEGALQRFQRDFNSVSLDGAVTLSYPNTGPVRSNLSIGVQGFREDVSIVSAFGRGFALPGSKDFGEAADVVASESNQQVFTGGVFVDERVRLWDRLVLNAGVRIDGGTSFGDDVDFEAYPKGGIAYNVSDERFFDDRLGRWVDEFRLRAAYGETGKFPPPFLRDRTFDAVSFRGESAPRFDNPGNPDLRPEVTKTFEAGFEAAFFNNRLGIDFNYYDAETEDALFFVPEQPVTGQGTQIRNVGTIENRGVEVDVNLHVLNRPNLAWHVGASFQTVDNEITDMGGAAPFFLPGARAQQHIAEGHPVGAWFVNTPVDTNDDGHLDGFQRRYSGSSPMPTRSGSFSSRVILWDALQLSALADWAGGHEVFDWGSVWATFNGIFRREIQEPGFEFPIRHDLDGNEIGPFSEGEARSAFLVSGDYVKLREISARYTLPEMLAGRLGADRGAIYGSVRNVAIWSETAMIDPELSGVMGGGLRLGGENSITISPPRAFRFGVELVF